jgi:hypothetical protein
LTPSGLVATYPKFAPTRNCEPFHKIAFVVPIPPDDKEDDKDQFIPSALVALRPELDIAQNTEAP